MRKREAQEQFWIYMKDMVVSIGVCAKDAASTLPDALESVLCQDFPSELAEIILVDDGSKDGTLSIMKHFSRIQIPVFRVFSHSWKGLGYSRNVVLKNATGKYVLWVDADMILSRDYVKMLVDFMEEHSEVGIAKGRDALEPSANLLATLETFSRAASHMVDYSSEKMHSKVVGTGGAIWRVAALKQAGWFDENLRGYGEDADAELRIRDAGYRFAMVDRANFKDLERAALSWKSLWTRYWIRGYHTHYFLHKNKNSLKHYKMFPPAAGVAGLLQANTLFRLTHMKIVFLLPLESVFKMSAWYVGFLRSHKDSYEP